MTSINTFVERMLMFIFHLQRLLLAVLSVFVVFGGGVVYGDVTMIKEVTDNATRTITVPGPYGNPVSNTKEEDTCPIPNPKNFVGVPCCYSRTENSCSPATFDSSGIYQYVCPDYPEDLIFDIEYKCGAKCYISPSPSPDPTETPTRTPSASASPKTPPRTPSASPPPKKPPSSPSPSASPSPTPLNCTRILRKNGLGNWVPTDNSLKYDCAQHTHNEQACLRASIGTERVCWWNEVVRY